MKVLVTGESGQLGHDVCLTLERRGIAHKGLSSKDLDIRDSTAVQRVLEAVSYTHLTLPTKA